MGHPVYVVVVPAAQNGEGEGRRTPCRSRDHAAARSGASAWSSLVEEATEEATAAVIMTLVLE
jgi:hypothetical protein